MVDIKRVSYSYNSALADAGQASYFLDVLISRDGRTLVDKHDQYSTREDFLQAIENIVPVIEGETDE